VECRLGLAPASAVAGWAQGAIAGVAGALAIGAVVIGAVVIGAVVIGAVVIGVAATGVVVTGTAAIGVTTSSLSATSGFPTGGAGAIPSDTTVTITTRTITTAMGTATDMITASLATGTAVAANQGLLSCSGDSPALAIIVALLTGSWGPRRGEQFELTSAIMEM
jgi:hypothetical protein